MVLILVQLRTIAFVVSFCPTLETSPVSTLWLLLLVLWSWRWELLVLICRPWTPTVFGLMTHLEASLTTNLITLATVMFVAGVTLRKVSSIPSLSVAARGVLTGILITVCPSLLGL